MDPEKEEFLKEFGADYGYPNGPKSIDQIRATEFKRLDGQIFSLSLFPKKISIPFFCLGFSQTCSLFGCWESWRKIGCKWIQLFINRLLIY